MVDDDAVLVERHPEGELGAAVVGAEHRVGQDIVQLLGLAAQVEVEHPSRHLAVEGTEGGCYTHTERGWDASLRVCIASSPVEDKQEVVLVNKS